VSGPLLDRIDIKVEVPRVALADLGAPRGAHDEDSASVRARVIAARQLAQTRGGRANAELGARAIEHDCALGAAERALLERAAERLDLSARGYHRVLRVARTIADLDGGQVGVGRAHLAEALQFRGLAERVATSV